MTDRLVTAYMSRLKYYTKKPVTIKAAEWDGTEEAYFAICQLAQGVQVEGAEDGKLVVHTLEGKMRANKGDYIVRGVKGEIYPIRRDIFEETYEPFDLNKVLNELEVDPNQLSLEDDRGKNRTFGETNA